MIDTDSILVRTATPGDFNAIYQFMKELEETDFNAKDLEEAFNTNLQNVNNIYLVAECKNTTVGFVSCHLQLLLHHAGWIGEIQEFFVVDSQRGMGIGRKLLQHLKIMVIRKGVRQLEVTAHASRVDTHRFYEKTGFRQTHKKFVMSL
jgi:PhnO protein